MRVLKVVLSYVTDVATAEDKSSTGTGRTLSKQNFLIRQPIASICISPKMEVRA